MKYGIKTALSTGRETDEPVRPKRNETEQTSSYSRAWSGCGLYIPTKTAAQGAAGREAALRRGFLSRSPLASGRGSGNRRCPGADWMAGAHFLWWPAHRFGMTPSSVWIQGQWTATCGRGKRSSVFHVAGRAVIGRRATRPSTPSADAHARKS